MARTCSDAGNGIICRWIFSGPCAWWTQLCKPAICPRVSFFHARGLTESGCANRNRILPIVGLHPLSFGPWYLKSCWVDTLNCTGNAGFMVDYGHTWFQSTKSLVLLFLSLDTSRLYWVSLPVSVSVMEVKPLVSKKAIVPLMRYVRGYGTMSSTLYYGFIVRSLRHSPSSVFASRWSLVVTTRQKPRVVR